MARKILRDLNYTFSPSTKTIVIPAYLPQERLILITNVTSNTVIYNFSDPNAKATSYTSTGGQTFPQTSQATQAAGQTTIVLQFNTTSMAAGDKLQFLIDEYEERFLPAETYVDPANKFRVSTPQSLIDTDFELGLQNTKWEFFQANNGAQSIFTRPTDAPLQPVYAGMGYSILNSTITVTGSNTGTITGLSLARVPATGSYVYVVDNNFTTFRYTVNASTTTSSLVFNGTLTNGTYNNVALVVIGDLPGTATNPSYAAFSVTQDISGGTFAIAQGTPIFVQDTFDETSADGTFTVTFTAATAKTFGFIPKSNTANYNILNRPNTVAYVGSYYGSYAASSFIPLTSITADGSRIVTVNTSTPHGLIVGTPVFVGGTTQTNANGPWYVLQVPSATQFTYATLATVGAGTISQAGATTTQVYLRPEGNQTHRPNDGGVQITPGNNVVGSQAIRQTRRYFRYQSGKGIQFSTAFTFKPNYDIVSLTVAGNIATVVCDQDHGLKPGAVVRFTGLTATNPTDQNVYNNTFIVLAGQPITAKQFAVQLSATPTDTSPGGTAPVVECVEAKGYAARAGLFDDQNGMFWEFDGSVLNAVRRNATSVLRGSLINVCTGSTLVTGDARSKFTKQCLPGDRVVIRGMTYVVTRIVSDTEMNISPPYRAATQSTAQGTSGLPYGTLTSASSQLQTINIQTSTTLSQVQSASSSGGASGSFTFTATFNSNGQTPTGSSGGAGLKVFTVSSATSIVPGMLVIGSNIPANTYVDVSYVTGSTTVPITNSMTGGASGTYYFYAVPASGVAVTGSNLGTNTFVSSVAFTTTGTTTTSGTVYLTQAMTSTAAGTYTFGLVPAGIATSVIQLATTFGIAPGMNITGSGIPGNCIVAYVQNQGTAIVLNQPITVAAGIGNGTSLTFTALHGLTAVTQNTSGSTSTATTSMVLVGTAGIQIGNFITTATPGQYFAIGTYVTNINTATNTVTLSQPPVLTVPTTTTVTFSSRVFIANSSQANVNGQWPVYQIGTTTITFHTAAAATVTGTISTYGTTRIFGEDWIGRKSIVRELRIPQTNFNLDTLDGRGPSGFNLDLTKAQMIFMDYTWYGAGFARWGTRNVNGDVVYCHKLQHGNTQYQAYLRSGNLPGRFELNNVGATTQITAQIASTGLTITPNAPGTITVFDASGMFVPFTGPNGEGKNGEVLVDYEYFYYTGLASTTGRAPWAVGDNGVTSVATLGTPVVNSGVVTSIPVTSGGAGYTSPPPVVISGPGGGARAVANLVGGSVVSISITSGGTGYTTVPTVYIGPNQLTGVVRESNAVTVGNLTGAVSTTGSTAITSVSNASSYYIGMKLAANAAFNNFPVTITGVSGTTVYVDTPAVTSGSITIAPVQKGGTAAIHYAPNNTSLPVSTAVCTVQQLTPAAQHWGVSVMMDGRFDNDKSYVFTTPRQQAAVVIPNTTSPLMSIRVSPSVSLGFARNFGVRDIINRMQMNLYQMDVYTSGQFLITVRYNCSSNTFQPALWTANLVGSGSLSQVIYHNPNDVVTGGDVVLSFYATNAGAGVFSTTQQDLTIVKDLGNSVIGGDSTYPDGPDVITVFATNLSTSTASPIYSRISWTEAQA
jgi:hypothetical protein